MIYTKMTKLAIKIAYKHCFDLLDYFDCDTGKEIEEKIDNYSNFSEIIYIAFTEKFEHIIVKLKKC